MRSISFVFSKYPRVPWPSPLPLDRHRGRRMPFYGMPSLLDGLRRAGGERRGVKAAREVWWHPDLLLPACEVMMSESCRGVGSRFVLAVLAPVRPLFADTSSYLCKASIFSPRRSSSRREDIKAERGSTLWASLSDSQHAVLCLWTSAPFNLFC